MHLLFCNNNYFFTWKILVIISYISFIEIMPKVIVKKNWNDIEIIKNNNSKKEVKVWIVNIKYDVLSRIANERFFLSRAGNIP